MKRFLIALITFVGTTASALETTPVKTFAPINDVQVLETMDVEANRIAKTAFERALNQFQAYAVPQLAKRGWTLNLERLWTNGTVNASTYRQGSQVTITMYGGFARFGNMTSAGLKLVACHELAHNLGGEPVYSDGSNMSVEGQSDYFAILGGCANAIGAGSDADLVLAKALAKLGGEAVPSYDTPDTSVVNRTQEGHPRAQCRLDTYRAARLGAARPRCWYAP